MTPTLTRDVRPWRIALPGARAAVLAVQERDGEAVEGTPPAPTRIEGLAVPYDVDIAVGGGREVFRMGAFAQAVREVERGRRHAYLDRHDGRPGAVIDRLWEARDGLHFGAALMANAAAADIRDRLAAGLDGVSVEFVPGDFTDRGSLREYRRNARLAAVAASYAPAYDSARAALRDQSRTTPAVVRRAEPMNLEAMRARRAELVAQAAERRSLAEAEGRDLDTQDRDALTSLDGRVANLDAMIAQAEADARDAATVAAALPVANRSAVTLTRTEPVYRPGVQESYFRDLVRAAQGDGEAGGRLARHRAIVTDLAEQLASRAIDSTQLGGAFPTSYAPDLYVPDVAYGGPFSNFFAETPIASPNPIILPAFGTVTGDTGVQSAQNAALPNVDVATNPVTITPKTIGGESIVSRQAVDGASPGTDVIIGTQLRELLSRDREREIALVLEALTARGVITDTGGTGAGQSGADLIRGLTSAVANMFLDRHLPAEGIFTNGTDWANLVAAVDGSGRPLMPYIGPVNSNGELTAPGAQVGVIAGVPTMGNWAILSALNEIVARRNDARQWASAVLDVRLMERNGPQSVVFAIWQYFAFAVLEPKGVRKWTYTNVLADAASLGITVHEDGDEGKGKGKDKGKD
jgi:HK97 family phage major capsid protein